MSSLFEFDPDRMEGSGIIVRGIAGEALGNRQLVYQGSDGRWYLADAKAAATMPTIGITFHGIAPGGRGQILLHGYIGLASWTWTIGGSAGLIYASTAPGAITQTAPTPPDYVQIVGTAYMSTIIYFSPFPPSEGVGVKTKEFFRGVVDADATVGNYPAVTLADGIPTYVYNDFLVPHDFHSLVSAHVVVVQGISAAPNMVWTCDTNWGEICGAEDYLAHTDSIGSTTSQILQNDLVCLDISAALTGIVARDLVGVSFMRDGGNAADTINGLAYYLGIRVRYT